MSVKETFSAGQTREFYGAGDFFRLLETNAEITLEFFYQGREVAEAIGVQAGYAEYFKDRRFDRIRIYSATAQDVKWVVREGSDVRYDRGASQVSGVVGLDAATLEGMRAKATGNYSVAAALAVNTAVQVFAPGANPNGATLTAAACSTDSTTGDPVVTLISKAGAAPASVHDGMVHLRNLSMSQGGSWQCYSAQLSKDIEVPAGHGLYWIALQATPVQSHRFVSYKIK